ncbi:MAG: YebC/PmpR family DNA-binding transcriptional regulator [Bacteroidota bacterium]|nr:YebC/PmpR family DNA-binding transcriptional regulator [Bacteroidota bacterium]MDP4229493.1 YebC/PmpR family DNA-binding transcriptional regulator [Bacteroidota bacterium]MDP4236154.1 YebC/PmpR family DNA-binding transcriptional regulator [Bacteroidota bacterium]
MSGHSKWAQIKRKKAVTDTKRGQMFTRLIKEIVISARLGGPDLEGNARLRLAVERARKSSMPNDNIKRAISRGAGGEGSSTFEELTYEAYGPGGVAIMIETATDNRNRTIGEMRHIMSKYGGNIGETGSVGWMFAKKGIIVVPKAGQDEDQILSIALDAGADDLRTDDPDYFEIQTSPEQFEKVLNAVNAAGIPIEEDKVGLIASTMVKVEDAEAEKLAKLIEMLEENEDVQNVYSNAQF